MATRKAAKAAKTEKAPKSAKSAKRSLRKAVAKAAAPIERAGKKRVHTVTRRRAPAREYAETIYERLIAHYPNAHCALDFTTPFQLLIATILSAQCTDKRVNLVTPALFRRYPTPQALADANPTELEEMIKSTGFFRNKAKSLIGMAAGIVEQHGGHVPKDMDSLVHLPGVGRKTANVVLGNAFDTNEGVVVDTHVSRVTQRLGLTHNDDPVKIEQDLMVLFPRDQWTLLSHLLIEHGRTICDARRPKCEECFLNDLCPSSRV